MVRTLAPLAAVAVSVTACAQIEPLETTGLYEVFTGPTEIAWCAYGDHARLLEEGADLAGPHFSASLLCHYAGTEAPDHAAEEIEELADLPQLVGGAELLVDQIALAPTYETQAVGGSVAVWIEVGDERLDLEAVPEPGSYLAVTVPIGEDTVLWIEDEGRAQGLDLRTGSQVEPVAAYYNGVGTGPVDLGGYAYEEVRVLNSSQAYHVTCSDGAGTASRSVWDADRGWAADGTVLLAVEFDWCDAYEDTLLWALDPEAAVTVANGEEILVPVDWREEAASESGWITVTAWFEIPANVSELTVEFLPVGGLENLEGGQDFAFADTPDTTEWELSF